MKEHVWHLRRHLLAREPDFVGIEIPVPGTDDTAFVGNGIHPDKEAHLTADQYALAEAIGETLYLPVGVDEIYLKSSPLARANETARHMFVGMARAYARMVLGIDASQKLSPEMQRALSELGLHKRVGAVLPFQGLQETRYRNSAGKFDDGNQLVAEAYHKGVNPNFPGYAYMAQKGFENDPRSEHPYNVAQRGLDILHHLVRDGGNVLVSGTHQWNLEAITACLTGNLGRDGNELFANAGGGYGLGGGFELQVYEDHGQIREARLMRTTTDPKVLDKELTVDLGVLAENL